ncbi:MAG: protein kinase [Planctomycetaceae bacterium]|nr:protein kinase [Planctomycetaceae bacterium]
MPVNPLDDDALRTLGNEFARRLRRGEKATVEEYTTRFEAKDAERVREYLTSVERKVQVATKTTISRSSKTVAPTAEPPREFGRYQIERTLGEGGMGAVYLAHDSQLDRKVALKTPKFSKTSDATTMQRFYREARSAATLQHPNICPVYDVGEINGTHYISMAYIEGQPLSDLVRAEKQPPVATLLKVVRKVALALHEAHLQGLIHRDLKPANIMIDRRNEPIVMDFGLARQFGDDEHEPETTAGVAEHATDTAALPDAARKVEARITIPGTVMGSPGYMAPEQLTGDQSRIGPTSDVYAMGVLLYELLTGELPFPGTGTLISVVNSVMSDPPPDATVLRSGLDPRIASICRRAMSKRPEDRYDTMQAFALALTKVLRTDAGGRTTDASRKLSPELVRQKEQFELARSLCQEGQYAGAVSIMEKMVATDGEASQYSKWAEDNIADARMKAEEAALVAATGGDLDGDDLWNTDSSSTLPPKRRRKGRRRRHSNTLTRKLVTIAIATLVVAVVAINVRRLLQGNGSTASADDTPNHSGSLRTADDPADPDPLADNSGAASPPASDNSGPEDRGPDNRGPDNRGPDNRGPEAPGNRPTERPAGEGRPGERPRVPNRRGNLRDRLFQLDQDGDGRLTREELKAGPAGAMLNRVRDQFDRIDGNNDGALDGPELDRAQEQGQPGNRPPFRPGQAGRRDR